MSNQIEIYERGTFIKLKNTAINGIILGALIKGDFISYEVALIDNDNQRTIHYIEDVEIEILKESVKQKIGFKKE